MFTEAYKRYALAVMTLTYAINLFDRGLMTVFIQSIKEELLLSDTQIGFVTGIAFALFYATMGVPIARWADRGNRVTIISLSIGLWGVTVMACLFVSNFIQLVFARILAAVGDSGCRPPMYSLLGDYFRGGRERTRAIYIFETSVAASALITSLAAGWLNERFGWRLALFLAGMPGVLMALVTRLTLVEPRVASPASVSGQQAEFPPMRSVLATLWRQRSCRHMIVGIVCVFIMGQGMGNWYGPFLIRVHDLSTTQLGLWMGLFFGVGGIVGLMIGGLVMGLKFMSNERTQMRLAGLSVAAGVPFFAGFLTIPDKFVAMAVLIPQCLLGSVFLPAVYVLLQRLVPDNMRATSLMVVWMLGNLIGMGLGPQVVGLLSDMLAPLVGVDSLRYAMLSLLPLALLASYQFYVAGKTIADDLKANQVDQTQHHTDARRLDFALAKPSSSK